MRRPVRAEIGRRGGRRVSRPGAMEPFVTAAARSALDAKRVPRKKSASLSWLVILRIGFAYVSCPRRPAVACERQRQAIGPGACRLLRPRGQGRTIGRALRREVGCREAARRQAHGGRARCQGAKAQPTLTGHCSGPSDGLSRGRLVCVEHMLGIIMSLACCVIDAKAIRSCAFLPRREEGACAASFAIARGIA